MVVLISKKGEILSIVHIEGLVQDKLSLILRRYYGFVAK